MLDRSDTTPRPRWSALALVWAAGCYVGLPGAGEDGDAAEGGGSSGAVDTGDDDGEVDPRMFYTCDAEQRGLRGTSYDHLRRLSSVELANTLSVLLGDAVVGDEQIATRLAALPVDATVIAGDFSDAPPVGLALALSGISARAAEVALADPTWVQARPACVGAGAVDSACAAAVVEEFGAKVWRRDLSDDEITEYVAFFEASGGGQEGLSYLLRRLLQAPSLVFHIEDGTGDAVDGRIRLTDFEVASRISYLTADTMPDDALMAAARAGELDSPEAVEDHVRRLLAADTAATKVTDFFRYYSQLTSVADPHPAVAALVGIDDAAGLGAELQAEAYEFFAHVFWRDDGDFAELMASDAAFPRSEALATVFGSAIATGDTPVAAAAHAGAMHRPAMLASGGLRTSPILRGAHVRKRFFCDVMPLPDPAAVEDRQEEVGDLEGMANRDRVTALTDAPACVGCHAFINPVGFAFEGYDPLGVPRTSETVVDADGNVLATWPIDTRVEDVRLEEGDPITLEDSTTITAAMIESYDARACFAQRVFEYYRLREVDREADGCALLQEERRAHDGTLVDVVVAAIANEDILWRKAPSP